MDRKTDELMQRSIREEFTGKTTIVIAHRLKALVDFDRVAVLDKGFLIECDKPEILLGRQSALREMYRMYESKENTDNQAE